VIRIPELWLILYSIPFWIVWIPIAAIFLVALFGRHRVILDSDGLLCEWHVLLELWRRQVPLSEIRRFRERRFDVDFDMEKETVGIEATTLGRSIIFGTNLSAREGAWLTHRLDEHRRHLQRLAGVADIGDGDLADCRDCPSPADCAWSVSEECARLTFQQRGTFSLGAILKALFYAVSCDSIVTAFFYWGMQAGISWWFMPLFLLPFEAIGLGMLIGLLLVLLEPFRITRWIITPEAIEQVTTRLRMPLGRRRRYPCDELDGAMIRDDLGKRWGAFALAVTMPASPTGEQHSLLLANAANREICSIRGLTLGEARWIKGRLQKSSYLR
jgi:hypothetical protein